MGLSQLLLQFRKGDIRLSGYRGTQILLDLLTQPPRRPMPQLTRPLQPTGRQLLYADLLRLSPTDAKLARQVLQTSSPGCIGFQ
jgi:hypothetical protein